MSALVGVLPCVGTGLNTLQALNGSLGAGAEDTRGLGVEAPRDGGPAGAEPFAAAGIPRPLRGGGLQERAPQRGHVFQEQKPLTGLAG